MKHLTLNHTLEHKTTPHHSIWFQHSKNDPSSVWCFIRVVPIPRVLSPDRVTANIRFFYLLRLQLLPRPIAFHQNSFCIPWVGFNVLSRNAFVDSRQYVRCNLRSRKGVIPESIGMSPTHCECQEEIGPNAFRHKTLSCPFDIEFLWGEGSFFGCFMLRFMRTIHNGSVPFLRKREFFVFNGKYGIRDFRSVETFALSILYIAPII